MGKIKIDPRWLQLSQATQKKMNLSSGFLASVNHHMNALMFEWNILKSDWVIVYNTDTNNYEADSEELDALFIVDYMRTRGLTEYCQFILSSSREGKNHIDYRLSIK